MSAVGEDLRAAIEKHFTSLLSEDKMATGLMDAIKNGTATFEEAEQYAARVGELLSKAITAECDKVIMPDDQLTKELVEEFLKPLLRQGYENVTGAAAETMEALNRAAGLNLKAVRPLINAGRVDGLIEKAASYDGYSEAKWIFEGPVENFIQNVCDSLIYENVETHFKVGLSPKITRKAAGRCCEWCSSLEGTYDYPVKREIYRRHERCRCLVLYDSGDGKVQDAHTKKKYDSVKDAEHAAKVQRRKEKLEKWEKESARYPEGRREILRRIKSGQYSLKQKPQKYLQHTKEAVQHKNATEGRKRHQSYLTISEKDAQEIINRYSGLGDVEFQKDGSITGKEYYSTGRVIGMVFDGEKYVPTDRVAICHAADGSHIYPVTPLEVMI